MAAAYPYRHNLRLSRETADVFEEAAETMEMDVTSLFRLFIDNAVPAVRAMATATREAKAGRLAEAMDLLKVYGDATLREIEAERRQLDDDTKVAPKKKTA